jgi:hypothetical protein
MDSPGELERDLQCLEEHLLQPATRRDAAALDALLCDDFVVIDPSGVLWRIAENTE